jgi:hypothetical protein
MGAASGDDASMLAGGAIEDSPRCSNVVAISRAVRPNRADEIERLVG